MNPIDVDAASAVETQVFVLAREEGVVGARDLHFQLVREGDGTPPLVRRARFLAPGGAAALP